VIVKAVERWSEPAELLQSVVFSSVSKSWNATKKKAKTALCPFSSKYDHTRSHKVRKHAWLALLVFTPINLADTHPAQ